MLAPIQNSGEFDETWRSKNYSIKRRIKYDLT